MKRKRSSRPLPDRKISETLLDYARPILEQVDEQTTQADLEHGLELAVTIWNAAVVEETTDADHYLAEIRERIRLSGIEAALDTVDALIDRRRREFAHDLRLIGDYTVTYTDGNLHVRAEARSNDPAHKSA